MRSSATLRESEGPIPQRSAEMQTLPAAQSNILFHGTIALLLFGPLAFGAVEPWAIFILEAGAAALFALWAWQHLHAENSTIQNSAVFQPMLAFAGLTVLQLVLGTSAYWAATLSSALLYCAYGMLCFLAVQSVRKTADIVRLGKVFTAYGAAMAVFAAIQGLTSNGKLYWLRAPRMGGWIYGPYVSHNNYAGLMEMLLPIPLVLCISRRVEDGAKGILAFAAMIMAGTVFLSGSRGGMIAVSVQIILLAAYIHTRRKSSRMALALGGFVVLAAALVLWLGGSSVADRLASIHTEARTELAGGIRTNIVRDCLHMFMQRPILGWGLGTFSTVYPQFRSFFTNMFVNEAHNDYAQLLVEMGLPGFAIMIWFLYLLLRRGLAKLKEGMLGVNGSLTLAGLLACSGILVHSWVDFNLQVPANAALFYVIATLTSAEPVRDHGKPRIIS